MILKSFGRDEQVDSLIIVVLCNVVHLKNILLLRFLNFFSGCFVVLVLVVVLLFICRANLIYRFPFLFFSFGLFDTYAHKSP